MTERDGTTAQWGGLGNRPRPERLAHIPGGTAWERRHRKRMACDIETLSGPERERLLKEIVRKGGVTRKGAAYRLRRFQLGKIDMTALFAPNNRMKKA